MQKRVLDIIPEGKENAIHLEELAHTLGVHPMVAKVMIRKARIEGAHILSDAQNGYWVSSVVSEMQAYVNRMTKHALSELVVIRPIVKALRDIDGQITLAEYLNKYLEESLGEQEKETDLR